MTDYTHEQIALMAKLVPEQAAFFHFSDGETEVVRKGSMYKWQPWSDWRDLGPLYLACYGWWVENGASTDEIDEAFMILVDSISSGDFDAFATAVCNLAIEIGRSL